MMAIDIQAIQDGKNSKTLHMEDWLSALGQLRPNEDFFRRSFPPMGAAETEAQSSRLIE